MTGRQWEGRAITGLVLRGLNHWYLNLADSPLPKTPALPLPWVKDPDQGLSTANVLRA